MRQRAAEDRASQLGTEWARTERRIGEIGKAFDELRAQAGRAATDAAAARARFAEQLAAASPVTAR
jgi:hypothetical protein